MEEVHTDQGIIKGTECGIVLSIIDPYLYSWAFCNTPRSSEKEEGEKGKQEREEESPANQAFDEPVIF